MKNHIFISVLGSILFCLLLLVVSSLKQIYAGYMECEYNTSGNYCLDTKQTYQGHYTWVVQTSSNTWSCTDQGQFYCNIPYWGQCGGAFIGGKTPGECWAGLSGSKPPAGTSHILYGPVHRGDSSACGQQAPLSMPTSADMYCVCGVPGAAACAPTPTPTTGAPSATPTPTGPAATPTPTVPPTHTELNVALQLPGIGQGGNLSPKHNTRTLHVTIYASGVDPTQPNVTPVFDSKDFTVTYNSTNGYFANTAIDVGTLPTGDYQLLVKVPGYLRKQYIDASSDSKTIHITAATTTIVPAFKLIVGDVTPLYNVMDISDFYAIVGCYGAKASTSSCSAGAQITDLNDDGVVDGIDLNYWLLGFQNLLNNNNTDGTGDGVPGD